MKIQLFSTTINLLLITVNVDSLERYVKNIINIFSKMICSYNAYNNMIFCFQFETEIY